jgi:sortase A
VKIKLSFLFLVISLGLFAAAGFAVWERFYDPNRLAIFGQGNSPSNKAPASASAPARLDIPSLGLSHEVLPAEVKGNSWPSTKSGVSYLLSSAEVGAGNTVIYGHNWPRILGNLSKLKVGESIKLTTQGGSEVTYVVYETRTVDPHTVSILDPSTDPILTLYTCSGLFDSKRLVVFAKMQ